MAGESRKDESRKEMTVREAGRKGGETTRQEVEKGELPKNFYQEIGKKGGMTTSQEVEKGELPKNFYSEIGHKGGQKVKELIERGKQAS
jgi:general stress protein YciG